jgi:ADP-ribose pyrophosphatase YjhB (NUDIX family)
MPTNAPTKKCDHTSVGMLVWNDNKLLLIERKKFPYGFAVPAGHVDGDETFEIAARRELGEEVGLQALELKLILDMRKDNPCRREGGTWHHWKLYRVDVAGELSRSLEETKQARWFTVDEVKVLAKRTESYINKEIPEDEWEKSPGLEPVMYELFKELAII